MVDFRAPSQEIIEHSITLIDEARAAGDGILVHCYMGIGRTGTVVAAYLTTQGLTGIEAIDRVRELRPGSVEVSEQEDAVVTYWANRQ
ncbi:dual specificity protein phosphatase family protein [bacterium]|nr:dual specificity protein phosphatase family protein [bacterium]